MGLNDHCKSRGGGIVTTTCTSALHKSPEDGAGLGSREKAARINSRLTIIVPWIIVPASKPIPSSLITPSSSSSSLPTPAPPRTSLGGDRWAIVGPQGDGPVVAVGPSTAVHRALFLLTWLRGWQDSRGARQTLALVAGTLSVVHPARTPATEIHRHL